jgi:hypothetical protein
MSLYEIALLGEPSAEQIDEIHRYIEKLLAQFRLKIGSDVAWHVCPTDFDPPERQAAAAAFFGKPGIKSPSIGDVLRRGIPVIPVVDSLHAIATSLPDELKPINGLQYEPMHPERVSTAILECMGLLPGQRRAFLSYRRNEARAAAIQLFDELSARQFDVFLDTHGVPPAQDFQQVLWHRLCDSDALVMLDTPTFFDSRWTKAEFGRALAKNISVLRVGWPGVTTHPRAKTASRIELSDAEDCALNLPRLTCGAP